ncbi:MAG: isoprenyl transferase [Thermosulfidibacteraceae bacterium]|mgnify:CR=1 FL=1|jgi:undecaprenyl diphosphate synthase
MDGKLPNHIAIIMDGNGRWAKRRGLPRIRGHVEGAKRAEEIVMATKELGIPYLTLFVFSTENWNRPKEEVDFLFALFEEYLREKKEVFVKEDIRILPMGRIDEIPAGARERLLEVAYVTKDCKGVTVITAINYGGRREILDGIKKLCRDVIDRKMSLDEINEDRFRSYLYLPDVPDPDLVIRTSGEIRISNFLIWQIAYSEFYFTDILWPDFTPEVYKEIVKDYMRRERRFGGLGEY